MFGKKDKAGEEPEKIVFEDEATINNLKEKKAKILKQIDELDPKDAEYVKKYGEFMGLFKSVEDSLKQEDIHVSVKIENANKALEPEQKKEENKTKLKQAAVAGGFALTGCAIVPIMDNVVGPTLSKVGSAAIMALFKK